jgi:hypothetical protein
MLQSFIGTFDAVGLRSLQREDDAGEADQRPLAPINGTVPFWAILDTGELPTIHQALVLGHRSRAWELLAEQAKCLGRLCG